MCDRLPTKTIRKTIGTESIRRAGPAGAESRRGLRHVMGTCFARLQRHDRRVTAIRTDVLRSENMSKQNNVNPDYYKLAGRERQGEAIVQDLQKQAFAEQLAETEHWQEKQSGPPPWKATPPSTSVTPEPEVRKPRRPRGAKKRRQLARRQVRSRPRRRSAAKTPARARTRHSTKSRPPKRR